MAKYQPEPDAPNIWFTSMIAVAQVLSNDNIALLRMMDKQKPENMTEMAELSARKLSNLSVTLKTLSSHSFVRLEKSGRTIKPVALFTDFYIQVSQTFVELFATKTA